MGLACPNQERMGPPDVAKIELLGERAEKLSHFVRIPRAYTGGPWGQHAYCPGLGAYTTPDTPAQGGPVCYETRSGIKGHLLAASNQGPTHASERFCHRCPPR